MFSSVEYAAAWASDVLGVRACTYAPRDARGDVPGSEPFCVVERTGGPLDWSHDSPEIAFQPWSRSEAEAEAMAASLAIAVRTRPMDDPHVNAAGVPDVLSYGREEGGWFVWQTSVRLEVNLLD